MEYVDCLLVPSKFAMERHRKAGIDRPMVHLPHFVPEVKEEGGEVSEEGPYFLYVGRLEKLKGVHDLIRLFAGYRAARLLIVGEGTYGDELRQQAKDLSHVKFLGKIHPSKLAGLYRGAVAVLVPSLCYETFGLTAAEALMHGTPAIVRRIGALTEIVEQTGGGFAFGTLDECREAMERLRTDGELRREVGARGREAAAGLWSPASHLQQYLGIVERFSTKQSASIRRAVPALTGP
jgi:glycosyltransferase involved in cell wall biosynthesis